jgi:hypothetical protein
MTCLRKGRITEIFFKGKNKMYMSHTIQLVIKIRGQESRKERGEEGKHCSHTWNGEFHIINLVKNEHHTTPGILTQSKINKKMRHRFGKISYPPILKLTVCKSLYNCFTYTGFLHLLFGKTFQKILTPVISNYYKPNPSQTPGS